jgi:hypothetical protein
MSSPMTTTLRKIESSAANEPFTPEQFSREEPMIAEPACGPPLDAHDDAPDRKLRNRIVIANAVAWVAVIVLIRLVFF